MKSDKIINVGIACLLTEEIEILATELRHKLYENFSKNKLILENIENRYFHISLYQLATQSSNLENLKDKLNHLAKSNKPIIFKLDTTLTDTQKRIFWNASASNDDQILNKLQTSIVNNIKNLRSELVNYYVTYWKLPFNPHITLIYNSGEDRKNGEGDFIKISKLLSNILVTKTEFKVEKLALIELGEEGNALKLLHTSPIKY